MTPDWTELDQELSIWAAKSLTLPLWWRDDDAIAPSAELTRLTDLSEHLQLPVHLAVIPRDATQELAQIMQAHPNLVPVVHGWSHDNHAPAGEKKSEFPSQRSIDEMLAEIDQSLTRMQDLFGNSLLPMFVPPWNRISPELLPWLAGAGFAALSTFTPRKQAKAGPGLAQINTHLDPIDWKGNRSLVDPSRLIAQVAQQLRDRRLGRADPAEPYGILTHHLVHDTEIWQFTKALLTRLLDGPGVAWQLNTRKI